MGDLGLMLDEDSFDLKKYLLSKEQAKKIAKDFSRRMITFLKKNRNTMFTVKGGKGVYGLSTTFGPYIGKQFALYLSKNLQRHELERVDLKKFYSSIEKELISKIGNKIDWRSNLLVDTNTMDVVEIEFIPLAFRGDFLLKVLKKCESLPIDPHMLIHAAVLAIGKLFNQAISNKGYLSTYPKLIDIETLSLNSLQKAIEEADFHIELRYIEKSVFSSMESELIERFSESPLEKKIGFELIKEAIPFLVQYEIKADFPKQKSKRVVSKPDFLILSISNPIAIFCDSFRYHQRKKDQILKDKRIDRKLQQMGFTVIRFSEEEINRNLKGCIEEIKEHYLGKNYALSTREVFIETLNDIDTNNISEWERRFVESLRIKLNQGKDISLKEERILYQIKEKLSKQ